MAEGFVLNISKEMLQRLDAADKKIVKIGESAEKTMQKINEAFGKKLTSVEDFIKQLNDIQQQLTKKDLKVNVDLALKNGALDSLKKQIEALGITIPVGVTATGTGGGNSAGVIPNGLNEALSQIATTIESITDKMRLLNQEYQAKVKTQQANDPKNIALIEKEKKEYEKLLKTISQLEKTKQKADRDIAKHGVNSAIGRRADVVSQQTDQQIQQANQRKLELERKYGTDLLQIRQANNVKELDEVRRQGNEEIKEYERVRSKILEINKTLYENDKTLKNTKDPNLQAQINNQNQALLNERSKLATRQLELERKHGNSLLSVQTQIGQKEVEFERKKQQDKIREVQQALRRRQDIERRWAQRNARLTEQKRNTADGALSFSQNEAKTIGQKLQAIKYLQNAQKSLDVTTSQGRNKFNELNREIKKTENELRRCGVQMNNFQEKSRHLFDITGQLGRALSLMFSVSQITQYVSKMVNVRKEMELQQRSLQVLLQNKDKANELWNQTLDLAVKSPFRVKELVTYTKQLAAYRIESDKLFETNKMLADVSAGLGVDMQRLILAFGQVKSASFLRGCLGKGTPIRLYNEDIKEVQNIVVGDVIMGDDNTPRNVKEIIYGKEQMYIVKQGALGDDYRVNENHILTLKDNITATIVDVYVKDYLKDKERYNGVKIGEDGNIVDYPIELIKDNIDEYFGFVIDGNKRFLLGDGTITHNTELRQFTEAGIPMLEELSKYFEEIYGKSVSVAEVFDMISKRMVTFTDVEKVFQRMTGAGGVFFNMQEELAQTTAGLISNLQDSFDLMFNEIGKKNQGIINDVIKAARDLVDNWETVGKIMKGALLTLLLYKAATIDISKYTDGIKGSWSNIKFLFSELKKNPLEFFQAFKGNIITTALTVIIALIGKVIAEHRKYKRAIEDVNKAHEKFRKSVSDVEVGFSEMFRNGNDNIDEYRDKLQELIGIAKQSYNIEIDFKVNELDSIDEVSRKFDDLKEKILSFNQLSLEFSLDFAERDDRGWEWFENYLGTDLKDLSESQKDMKSLASSIRDIISGTIKDVSELDKLNEKAESLTLKIQNLVRNDDAAGANKVREEFGSIIEQITSLENKLKGVDIDIVKSLFPQGVDETEYEYIQRIQSAISGLQEESKKSGVFNVLGVEMSDRYDFANLNIAGRFKKYTDDLKEAEEELLAFYKSSHSDVANLVNLSLRGQTLGFEPLDLIDAIKEQNEKDIDDLETIITRELTERGVNPTEEINKILQKIVEANNASEVNEEFKNLVDILNKQSLDEEVSKYIYNGLKNIATQKEFDEATLHKMLKDAEEYYKKYKLVNAKGDVVLETLDLDLIPKIKPVKEKDLEQWQKDLKAKLEKNKSLLQGSIPMVTFQTTQEKALKDAETAWKETEDLIKRIENARNQTDNDLISAYANYDVDTLKKKMEVEKDIWRELGGTEDAKEAEERIKEQIRLIKNLYEQYQKLSKAMGGIEAKQFITKDFAKLLNDVGLNISEIDFTNIAGIVSYLESLRDEAQKAGEDASFALEKAISETAVELTIMAHVQKTKDFENEINDMFSDYELSLELDKLDIPADWAKTFFGVETKSLKEIQKVLKGRQTEIDKANEIDSKALEKYNRDNLTEEEETIKKALELQIAGYKEESAIISNNEAKIRELIEKEQYERLKTYIGYARKSIGERAKLKLEEYNTLLDIEKTFKEQQDKIDKNTEYTNEEKERQKKLNEQVKNDAIANVEKESKEKMDKLEWEEFQKTDTFINLFRDLENASETMLESTLEKLQEFKEQWTDMPLEDMKQVIEKINELEIALANLSPRDTIKDSKEKLNKYIEDNEIKGNYSDAIAKLQKENFEFETQNLELEKVISNLEVYFRLLEEGKKDQADEFYNKYLSTEQTIQGVDEEGKQVNVDLSKQNDLTREHLKLLRKKVQLNKDNINDNQELLSDAEKLKNAYLKQAENIGKVQQVVGQLKNGFDSVVEAADALGADTEDIELFGNMANDILSSTLGMVQLQLQLEAAKVAAIEFGVAMNTALGVIGWIILGVQTIATIISSIAKSKDNKLVKEIETQQYKMEKLQKAYDDLAEKIDEAWSVQQLQEYHRELKSTTEDLITAQKAAIAAQEQRKKSSKVGSDEWKELQDMYATLDELEKQLEDTEEEIFSKITGNIMDDILGVTESFVDAWYDAFKETGDGLKGLEENFIEMLLNLVKRQAAMKVAGRFIDQWNSVLEQYVNNDDNLSLGEITSWANMIEQDLPALSSQLETFFKAFDGVLGDTQGNLIGLQRGIQGITEQQADILASYLNSIRFIVSDSNAQLKLLVLAHTGATTPSENPMVEQLRVIAQQTSAINTLLNSLTAPHPTLSGRGLKVVI